MSEMRIVLVDDHPIVRQGLKDLLDSEPGVEVVGQAENGRDALKVVDELKPDVLILDLMMPGMNGLEVLEQVRKQVPETKVVVLSMHSNEAYVLDAIRLGAMGYVLKNSEPEVLILAVREAAQGRPYLGPPLSERMIDVYVQRAEETRIDSDVDVLSDLTQREREVLDLVLNNYKNAEIAENLSISARTVETHRANMMRKLGVGSKTELFQFAIRAGIFPEN